jgi:hypothetical protein
MLIDKEIQKLLRELDGEKTVSFNFDGVPLTMSVSDHGSQFSLSALVYEGGNYIPGSVRKCLDNHAIVPYSPLKTSLKIDEDRFQIALYHSGAFHNFNDVKFQNLLEEFNTLVEEWRFKLDEHDKNDLIHVRVK